jgi:ATP-binding cassette subfamily F protein 3
VEKSYGEHRVFSDVTFTIKRGEKVAFVGKNGEGKSTLVKCIMNEIPFKGNLKIGHNVQIGYFAQNQEDVLDKKETVYSTLDRIAVGDIRTKLRDILGAFLFRGEDIDKRVSVLSGGERARLGMAKLMLQSHNFLCLDEPTNHMDIQSKDVLKQALKSFDGTLLIVSHDRDFLDGLVDKIYEFRDGKVREHLGGVQEFLERRKLESLQELERKSEIVKSVSEVSSSKAEAAPSAGKAGYAAAKEQARQSRKVRDRISWLEHEIEKQESRMQAIEAVLQSPGPSDDIIELTREYLECKRDLDAKTEEWGSLI